ncbi:MAG: DUF6879 family protein [Labedaea sp.]
MFDEFARSAFRMETLQVYGIPSEQEEIRLYLQGAEKPHDPDAEVWHQTIRHNAASGKIMQRLKVVRRPFTDYTRWLFDWGIPDNVAAGEDYRILDVTGRESPVPEQDYWMFDESTVVLMNYNPDGSVRSQDALESADIAEYLRRRDVALKESVPFDEYRARWSGNW